MSTNTITHSIRGALLATTLLAGTPALAQQSFGNRSLGQPPGTGGVLQLNSDGATANVQVRRTDGTLGQGTVPVTLVGATLPALTLSNSKMVTTSEVGDAVAHLVGAVPGSSFTIVSSKSDLSMRGQVVQVASALSLGDETLTVTESAPGYKTQTFGPFTLTGVAPVAGPAFTLASYASTTPLKTENFTSTPNVWTPTNTSGTYYSFGDNHTALTDGYDDVYHDARYQSTQGESQLNVDSGFPRAASNVPITGLTTPVQPFVVVPGGLLNIQARPANITFGGVNFKWTSGFLRYRDPAMVNFCLRSRVIFTDLPAVYAAFWMYPPLGLGPAEDDMIEFNFNNDRHFVTQLKHGANFNTKQATYFATPPSLGYGAYHTVVTCHLPNQIITAVDNVVTVQMAVPSDWANKQFDAIWNLSLGASTGTPTPGASYDMFVDGWRLYAGLASPPIAPHGVPLQVGYAQLSQFAYGQTTYISFIVNNDGEPATGVQTAWKLHTDADYAAANISGVQGNGAPASVNGGYTPGQVLDFAVRQTGPGGAGAWFVIANQTAPSAPVTNTPPGPVVNLVVTSTGAHQASGSWQPPTSGCSIDHYHVHFGYPANPDIAAGFDADTTGTSFAVSSLTSTYTYRAQVYGVCSDGTTMAKPYTYVDVTVQ